MNYSPEKEMSLLLKVQDLLARRDIPRGASVSAKPADSQKVSIWASSKFMHELCTCCLNMFLNKCLFCWYSWYVCVVVILLWNQYNSYLSVDQIAFKVFSVGLIPASSALLAEAMLACTYGGVSQPITL